MNIKLKKVFLSNGSKGYEVLGITMRHQDELPEEYLCGAPHCYKINRCEKDAWYYMKENGDQASVPVGWTGTIEHVERKLSVLQDCHDRLHRIKNKWSGIETYSFGD